MKLVTQNMASTFARTVVKTKYNSPHIFFGLGVAGIIGSAILACRATLKLEETLDDIRADVEDANDRSLMHSDAVITPEVIDEAERERAKEVSVITFKGALAVGKLYAPAVILGGVSVACLAGSHVQLTRRNAAITAAFTALTKSFDDYRARVREEVGEEKENLLYTASTVKEVKGPDGKKQLVREVNPDGLSIYARIFDEKCQQWKPNAEVNRAFCKLQEEYANHMLRTDGFVFLNDVYSLLGYDRTALGNQVGWIKNSDVGDNYVNFGMFEARNRDNINVEEMTIVLDFNVDGYILDKIP